jgi:predicted phosphodiesterase
MRYGILGDVHANLEALDVVLESLSKEKIDTYIAVGDIVGYGADPVECLKRIRQVAKIIVAGNHDFAAVGKLNIDFFNTYARQSALWTREQLSENDREFLRNLKLVEYLDTFSVTHSSLHYPELFEYIQTSYDAQLSFQQQTTPLCFVGHSHVPVTFIQKKTVSFSMQPVADVDDRYKVMVNVGSIGQPRDENPEAAYAVYDSEAGKVWIKRVRYDVDRAAKKIIVAGLPPILAERLRYGR